MLIKFYVNNAIADLGIAETEENKILINLYAHKTERALLNTFYHEVLHILFPQWSEKRVSKQASRCCRGDNTWAMKVLLKLALKGKL